MLNVQHVSIKLEKCYYCLAHFIKLKFQFCFNDFHHINNNKIQIYNL